MVSMHELNGLLLVDKPKDWTSFDVVAKVRGIITSDLRDRHKQRGFCRGEDGAKAVSSGPRRTNLYSEGAAQPADKASTSQESGLSDEVGEQAFRCKCRVKVGHSGTLDPKATGLLILAIGKATKSIDKFMKLDKIYEAELTLGKTSSTDDVEGEIAKVSSKKPTREQIEAVLDKFQGPIEQVPPIFSAIKVDGQRAYKAARAGKDIKMKSRQVIIKSIRDVRYEYPTLSFITDVTSGTYIRSLARDIGEKLGTGAYLSDLRRETVGEYSVQSAMNMNNLQLSDIESAILPTPN